jgi:hypothetical protein
MRHAHTNSAPPAAAPTAVLILNSGEWSLGEELPALPWPIRIYRDRRESRNELHFWFPRPGGEPDGRHVFLRYWIEGETRWCVEVPPDPEAFHRHLRSEPMVTRLRFTAPDGRVLWAGAAGEPSLADLTGPELTRLRAASRQGRPVQA